MTVSGRPGLRPAIKRSRMLKRNPRPVFVVLYDPRMPSVSNMHCQEALENDGQHGPVLA